MKKKNLLQRTILIVLITLAGIYIVIGPRRRPTLQDFSWSGIKTTLATNIHLGLDLKGGSHLVMRVKTDEVLKTLTMTNAAAIQVAAKDAGLPVKEVRPEPTGGNYRITLEANDASKLADIEEAVKKKVDLSGWTSSISGNTIVWTLPVSAQSTLAEQATEQAQRIIESRLDAVGVAEPLVQRHGSQASHQILVQMPGIHDPERVKQLLKAESKLELVHVVSPPRTQSSVQTYNTEDEAKASLGGTVPTNRRVLPYSERTEPTTAGGQPADVAGDDAGCERAVRRGDVRACSLHRVHEHGEHQDAPPLRPQRHGHP